MYFIFLVFIVIFIIVQQSLKYGLVVCIGCTMKSLLQKILHFSGSQILVKLSNPRYSFKDSRYYTERDHSSKLKLKHSILQCSKKKSIYKYYYKPICKTLEANNRIKRTTQIRMYPVLLAEKSLLYKHNVNVNRNNVAKFCVFISHN